MPCYSLSVVKGRVSPNVVSEVVNSQKALEGLRRLVEAQAGLPAQIVDRTQAHRPEIKVICIQAGAITVNLFPAGITVQSATASQATLQALTEAVDTQARRMAIALSTERSLDMLRARYVVSMEAAAPNGARTIKLSL